ncbi:prepilin-type N-terminal cleavage/methylation domain-containing protein [Candidatus Uhrbacteria bacterium]|nr:prepilin-type N-terminal cleavage/methylation domain-containing protein [Candidatus Uhrbacteria bacterium]
MRHSALRERRGFTLIELLVVIGIIGLLSTLAVVALSSARRQARDAKRVSDMKSLQSALEIYATTSGSYPTAATAIEIGKADGTNACLTDSGFVTSANCGTASLIRVTNMPSTTYLYTCTGTPCTAYSITFDLEGKFGDFSDGSDTGANVDCTVSPSAFGCD